MNTNKILKDPFFGPLFEKEGLRAVKAAGYFEDSSESDADIDYMLDYPTTPIANVVDNFQCRDHSKVCVLVSAGSFCPPHEGHIDMMKEAKAELNRLGYFVLAGYLSPGHSEYIDAKTGSGTIPTHHRIKMCNDLAQNTGWIFVDPWEGMFNKVAINFTRVVDRMEQYLKRWVGDIPVFFVCGGDNVNFSSAFKHKGNCVVVNRPTGRGVSIKYIKQKDVMRNYRNVIFASDGNNTMSSTDIRKKKSVSLSKRKLFLRVEENMYKFKLPPTNKKRIAELLDIIEKEYTEVEISTVEDQRATVPNVIPWDKTISLDSMIPTKYNLRVSRHYDFFGLNWLRFAQSPNTFSLSKQIANIPQSDYVLYDDDVQGGGTMKFVREQLEKVGITVRGFSFMIRTDGEVLDLRDFIINKEDCGLVVELPNKALSRVPYMYPYVCPYSRASILDPMGFSIKLWRFNAEIYEQSNMTVSDLDEMWPMIRMCGFNPEMKVSDWCKHHVDLLTKFV